MKKNNSMLVLGILSISLLIILSIIQSSTAQRSPNDHASPRSYNMDDYSRYDHRNPYTDGYHGYFDYSEYDEHYYYEDLDLSVRVPW